MTLLGRGNTCVNTGGEKVFPEEVEGALKSHPDVFDALVVGVPDERLGQRVAAARAAAAGHGAVDLAELGTHVRGQIAGYKVPRSIWLVDPSAAPRPARPTTGGRRQLPPEPTTAAGRSTEHAAR